jgi:alpha-1,6-mannosyltransferase
MARIAQVANFVGPHSGGIRTVLGKLAEGYAGAGHQVLQIVPGARAERTSQPWGTRLVLPGHSVPGTGYRLLSPRPVERALGRWRPDRLEVHDRSTLRGLGSWARSAGIPALAISHERLDRLLAQWAVPAPLARRLADHSNAALAAQYDAVVCTTEWAAEEFVRIGAPNLRRIPLGVDLQRFRPEHAASARSASGAALLVLASRLSPEKRPGLAVRTVAELAHRGVLVELVIAGDGPLRRRLERAAGDLPVRFVGHLDSRRLAGLLADADVVLAPGPVETFGLAALEALASATPVVANAASALPQVLGSAGSAADGTAHALADAVLEVLARPEEERRKVARRRAERYPWSATVAGFLAAHGLPSGQARVA